MKSSSFQSLRIKRRRAHFTRFCPALPGWKGWLRKGLGLIGLASCPSCGGVAYVDVGPCQPEVRCQQAGCRWLGVLNEYAQALIAQRRAA